MKNKKIKFILISALILISFSFLVYGFETLSMVTPLSYYNVSGSIWLNATPDDPAVNVTFRWENINHLFLANITTNNDTGSDTYFNVTFDTTTLPDGVYNLTLNATNSTGFNISNSSTFFFITVDNTPPTINLETINNSNKTTNTPTFTFNYTDAIFNTSSCTLFIGGAKYGTNNSVLNHTSTALQANSTVSQGTTNWQVNCTDASSNVGNSSVYTVTVAFTGPTVTIDTPSNKSSHKTDFILNTTITDNIIIRSVFYRLENSTGSNITDWLNLTNSTATNYNATINISNLSDGNYTLRINATNSKGFNTTNSTIFFWVDTTNPSITFTLSATSVAVSGTITGTCSATDLIDTSVSTAITGIDTSSAGSKTATCTATDDAGNSVTSQISYTVTSSSSSSGGGGGGGSSGSTAYSGTINQQITNINKGSTAKVTIPEKTTAKGNPVRTVEFKVNKKITSVQIITSEINKVQKYIREKIEKNSTIYKFFSVNHPGVLDSEIDNAKIRFAINKSWVTKNKFSKEYATLYRLKFGEWKSYKTKLVNENDNEFVFESEIPGLSTFAIGFSNETKKEEPKIENNTQNITKQVNKEIIENVQLYNTSENTENKTSIQSRSSSTIKKIFPVLLIFGILTSFIFYFLFRKEIAPSNKNKPE